MPDPFKMFYTWDPSDPPRFHCDAIDAQGQSIGGFGTLPRIEYFEALKRLERRE